MTTLYVLYLEDSIPDVELAVARLELAGYEVHMTHVETRAAFLAALRQSPLDLVLSDNAVLGYSALEALQEAQEHRPELPVILLSGTIHPTHAEQCIAAGATDFIAKHELWRLPIAIRSIQAGGPYSRGETAGSPAQKQPGRPE